MTRAKILAGMYELVGGVSPVWIEDFQKLDRPDYNSPQWEQDVKQLLDDMAEWNYHYEDLKAIIEYEKTLQQLFNSLEKRLQDLIDSGGDNETIADLKEDLEDVLDALKGSYITLDNYLSYDERASKLFNEIT